MVVRPEKKEGSEGKLEEMVVRQEKRKRRKEVKKTSELGRYWKKKGKGRRNVMVYREGREDRTKGGKGR